MNINLPKTKVIKIDRKVSSPISRGSKDIETVEKFCHPGSIISTDEGTDKDMGARIGKARHTFRVLRTVCLSKQFSFNPAQGFSRCFPDQLLLAHAVFSNCLFILEPHFGKVW